MTWFEVEQIDSHLDWLELQLDQWRLGRYQMQIEVAELTRAMHKAEAAFHKDLSSSIMKDHLLELRQRSDQCRRTIQERLKLR